jgi:DnaK suppressor protein
MTHEQFKALLEAKRDAMTRELATLGIHDPHNESDWVAVPPEGGDEPDSNDVADAAESWEERASTIALLETEWNNVRRALTKIADGAFGTCEICGALIEEARLKAHLTARTCISHKDEEGSLSR